jgi:hypothetical protein
MIPNPKQEMDHILESAVIASWGDLTRGVQNGLIHVEYGFASDDSLEYLQIWSSITRGYWLLACAYWMAASEYHKIGVHFDNGYQSEGLAHVLGMVMQNQKSFVLPPNLGRQGLLQISDPTPEESTAAAASLSQASDRISSALATPAVA